MANPPPNNPSMPTRRRKPEIRENKQPHPARSERRGGRSGRSTRAEPESDPTRILFGLHTIEAALANPDREIIQLYLTENAERRLADALGRRMVAVERVSPRDLNRRLGADTVHQGAMADVAPLPDLGLEDLITPSRLDRGPLIVLDQVTDPHNVGAVLRSAAVFGACGVILPRRHSPPLGGTLAKSASGALELVPIALVQNLGDAMQELRDADVRLIGLDGEGDVRLENAPLTGALAIVLGAEGKGLRQRTRELCHTLCRIATPGVLASLNVSNAAAVALHLAAMRRNAT